MTTVADLVASARRIAYGSAFDQLTLLGADYTAGDTTLVVNSEMGVPPGIVQGRVLSSGLNVWYVKGVSAATNEIFVIPGYQNSPQEAANEGDFLYVNPKVTDFYLFSVINDILLYLSSPTAGLYTVNSWTVVTDPTWETYPIPDGANVLEILALRYLYPGSTETWLDVDLNYVQWQPVEGTVRLTCNLPVTTLQFLYKGGFTAATSLLDDPIADCGLAESQLDLPPLGAAVRLLRTTENKREQIAVQGDSRRASEVLAGSNSAAANALNRDFQSRIDAESLRLIKAYPYRLGI